MHVKVKLRGPVSARMPSVSVGVEEVVGVCAAGGEEATGVVGVDGADTSMAMGSEVAGGFPSAS
jgi:hypothetical protein